MHFKNRSQSLELAKEVRQSFPDKTIWMYTGDVWESICDDEIMQYIDVLVDGEFKIEEKDTQLHWKGSANQRVIDVPASLEKGDVVLHA
jgi:anaerobic ribonucleoside-triphosphate reductase activating protein